MKVCVDCGKEVDKESKFCPHCGLIFFTKPAKPVQAPVAPAVEARRRKSKILQKLSIGALLLAVVAALYYLPSLPKRFARPEIFLVGSTPTDISNFDIAVMHASPLSGLAWDGHEFLLCDLNGERFVRVRRVEKKYEIRKEGIADEMPVTWNGKAFIAYSHSGLPGYRRHRFTAHDSKSLKVLQDYSAPEAIGGLAWDGSGYWACTSAEEEAQGLLYRLNLKLEVVNKMAAPSNQCKGLAWDGSNLWFMDGLERKLHVLDVRGIQAAPVHSFDIFLPSPSGIAFDGNTLWVNDVETKRLFRLQTSLFADVRRRLQPLKIAASTRTIDPSPNEDMYSGPTTGSKDGVEVNFFSATIKSDALYASWGLYFEEELFRRTVSNRIAKYTVSIDGGTLPAPVAKVYDAYPGRNSMEQEILITSPGPGTYHVGLFIYLRYNDSNGDDRVITKSIPSLAVIH